MNQNSKAKPYYTLSEKIEQRKKKEQIVDDKDEVDVICPKCGETCYPDGVCDSCE